MLLAKVYAIAWLTVIAAALIFIFAQNMTNTVTMILGFAASVLVGAGMLVVYPVVMNEEVASQRRGS